MGNPGSATAIFRDVTTFSNKLKSILSPNFFLINQDAQETIPGEFVTKEIGPAGGVITCKGVKLSVPEDALDTLVSIRVGVLWGKQFVPSLEEDAALLSPVVCCEPRGLTFRKWVTLTMPHCAVNLTTDWQLEVSFILCVFVE